MRQTKAIIQHIPIVNRIARDLLQILRQRRVSRPLSQTTIRSKEYWENRYAHGGTSGAGSYGLLAEFKAEILNAFVQEHQILSVIEFGCGDGNQLSLAHYPAYIGLDVSKTAIRLCIERFRQDPSKSFFLYDSQCFMDRHNTFTAELALSLDVIFHLLEDDIFECYMQHLFAAAKRYVIIYSSNTDEVSPAPHIKHRHFTAWIEANLPGWKLAKKIPNRYPFQGDERTGSFADFYIYEEA